MNAAFKGVPSVKWKAIGNRVVIISLLMTSVVPGSPASAAIAACSGGSITGFSAGFETYPVLTDPATYMRGTIATMGIRSAHTCTSDTDTSTNHVYAISGVEGLNGSPSGFGWARVGYRRYVGNSTHYFFAEWSQSGSGLPSRTAFAPTAGSSVTATVEHNWECDCLKMLLGTYSLNSGIDPEDEWDPRYTTAEFQAIAKYLQSDIPGTSTNRTQFSNLRVQGPSGFRALNPNDRGRTYPTNANARWAQSEGITSTNVFQIFCSSIDCG